MSKENFGYFEYNLNMFFCSYAQWPINKFESGRFDGLTQRHLWRRPETRGVALDHSPDVSKSALTFSLYRKRAPVTIEMEMLLNFPHGFLFFLARAGPGRASTSENGNGVPGQQKSREFPSFPEIGRYAHAADV